jgi:hypothetical protein
MRDTGNELIGVEPDYECFVASAEPAQPTRLSSELKDSILYLFGLSANAVLNYYFA